MATPPVLTADQLDALGDPAALLEHAWALEPWSRYVERSATLDALERLLAARNAPAAPPGRDWHLELVAEQAIDLGREGHLEEAIALADEVIRGSEPAHRIAPARAMLARGQALAWLGTDGATREAHRVFAEAAERFAALGQRDWQGSAMLRRGYSAAYQHGDLAEAAELIRQALEAYPPESMRLAGALCNFADVLIDLGEFDEGESVLDRALAVAEHHRVDKVSIDVTWARGRLAAARGDAHATERLLREAEREAVTQDWFSSHIGTSFLLDVADLLDLVGLTDQARSYLERAREHAVAVAVERGELVQTSAVLHARSGDPSLALDELQEIVRQDWLEKRVTWRHTLLTAWATFRAGREGAGELAARAFEQAIACGSLQVARAGEPQISAALAPLAERAGSAPARAMLLEGRQLIVRLFGPPTLTYADGSAIELPQGMPGQLVRWLALHERGLPLDIVLEEFFRDTAPPVARRRLRQVLKRLRTTAGDLVVRDGGEILRLVPAWVDVREFLSVADRVRPATGARAVRLAYAALALHTGPLLPSDPYAGWADETRDQVSHHHLDLLDLVAADAAARGSYQEALTALEAAAELDSGFEDRRAAIAAELRALRRRRDGE